jgi:3-methyladenine DNA glycosylase AlkC
MAEPFKNWIDAALVATAATHLQRAWRGFPREAFEQQATRGLGKLELKQRVQQVAGAIAATLPDDFARACDVVEATLAPPQPDFAMATLQSGEAGLAGWIVWPLTEFVALRGLAQPERALRCLHALTQRLTAEFAIRPFLVAHEALVLRTLHAWCGDPSMHVRRLVSEGSRPRLPWGIRLQRFVRDPSPTLPLLECLQDDASEYVRRSVANHLNDVAKDHPAVVADWLRRYLPDAPQQRVALLTHASRTLVKQGDRAVLAAFGLDAPLRGRASLSIEPTVVKIGGAVELVVELRSSAKTEQKLVVDYVVHRVLADGSTSPKVWKGWKLVLQPRETKGLRKRHSLQKVTVRTDRPGKHAVELLVNGRVVAGAAFELRG